MEEFERTFTAEIGGISPGIVTKALHNKNATPHVY